MFIWEKIVPSCSVCALGTNKVRSLCTMRIYITEPASIRKDPVGCNDRGGLVARGPRTRRCSTLGMFAGDERGPRRSQKRGRQFLGSRKFQGMATDARMQSYARDTVAPSVKPRALRGLCDQCQGVRAFAAPRPFALLQMRHIMSDGFPRRAAKLRPGCWSIESYPGLLSS